MTDISPNPQLIYQSDDDPLDRLLNDPAATRAAGLVRFLGPMMGGLAIACEAMHQQGMTLEQARWIFEFQFLVKDDDDA